MNYDNILFYSHNTDGTSDKIYGAIEVGGHAYGFYGKRNPAEDPKEKCSMTVIDIGKDCETYDDELYEVYKLMIKKASKGYNVLYASEEIRNLNIRRFIGMWGGGLSTPDNIIGNNYHDFEKSISKKLSKKVMLRK